MNSHLLDGLKKKLCKSTAHVILWKLCALKPLSEASENHTSLKGINGNCTELFLNFSEVP